MIVVFLDIDGVLNDLGWRHHQGRKEYPTELERWAAKIDPKLVSNLNYLTQEAGASLLITSSWRIYPKEALIRQVFDLHGVQAPVLGVLPRESEYGVDRRGAAIKCWLDAHPEVSRYVILDDDIDEYMDCYVRTDPWEGALTFGRVRAALAVLKGAEG